MKLYSGAANTVSASEPTTNSPVANGITHGTVLLSASGGASSESGCQNDMFQARARANSVNRLETKPPAIIR